MARIGRLIAPCLFALGCMIILFTTVVNANDDPPLGEHCTDIGPLPPPPEDWCGCVWGMVYVQGQPVSGITVTLSLADYSYSMTTIQGDEPFFAIDGRLVMATVGSPMTLTATYNDLMITRVYHALPDPVTMEQQVNLIFPQSGGNAPTAVLNSIIAQIDRAMFDGSGLDNDEGGSQILGYEWASNLDGVIGTEANVNIPLAVLTQDLHTISLRVQDDEGQWSMPVNNVLNLLDLYPLFITPTLNSFNALTYTNISLIYNHLLNPVTINSANVVLHANATGSLIVSPSTSGATVTLDPPYPFFPGEQVEFTITDAIASVTGQHPPGILVGRFRTASHGGSGYFTDGGIVENFDTGFADLADVDNDGDLDVVAIGRPGSSGVILENYDGRAHFMFNGEVITGTTKELDLGDLDGDGDLDIYAVSDGLLPNDRVLLNDGQGHFTPTNQNLGDTSNAHAIKLGDLDGDGDLDAFVAVYSDQQEEVWFNDGTAHFTKSSQQFGDGQSVGIELGDVDLDGDLDALVVNANFAGNTLYFNDSNGFFNYGQTIGTSENSDSQRAALEDLDGDGDLDAFIVNQRAKPDEVWFNNGNGVFYDSGQRLDTADGEGLALGDLDGDGDLDAFIGNERDVSNPADTVWFNNGQGYFIDSGQRLGSDNSVVALLGDLDGDGDLDVFINNTYPSGGDDEPAQVWLNTNTTAYLNIDKTAPETGYAGSPIHFTIHVTNTGNIPATNLVVTDVLPVGATYVSGGSLGTNNLVTWEIPSLPSGSHVDLTLTVTALVSITNSQYGVEADGNVAATGNNSVTVQVIDPVPTTWLALLYLDGDNNLQYWMENALVALQNPGVITSDVRVLVLLDGNEFHDTALYEVQAGTLIPLNPNETWYSSEANMGHDETLTGFVNWAQNYYPAQYTYLSIANHGAGVRGISWDETANNDYLNPDDLVAFSAELNNHVDVLHLDACLMSMAELAYLFRNNADYLVASQNLAWGIFAYDDYLVNLGSRLPDEFAIYIADTYAAQLSDRPHTISALDLNQMSAVNNALDALTTALLADDYSVELNAVMAQVQRFDSQDYFHITPEDEFIDLYDFARLAAAQVDDPVVDGAAQALMDILGEGQSGGLVMREHHLSGFLGAYYWDLEGAHGLSIYYPAAADSIFYDDYLYDYPYAFLDTSGWRGFLETYVGVPSLTPLPPAEPAPTLFVVYRVFLPIMQGD